MEKQKKKRAVRYLFWTCAIVLVALLAILPMLASGREKTEGPEASILAAQAENRDIATRIIGGGRLASEAAIKLEIPAEVKLTEFLVGNGDTVREGDAIALVDKISVMSAITGVQETLEYLSGELAKTGTGTATESIKALAGGTVKAVYAQPGENAEDVMLRDGALAVVSLDGLMAVQIEKATRLRAGDKVTVAFQSGTEAVGRVKTNVDGVLTVTVADRNYPLGEIVTVIAEDGQLLGSGELYLYSPWYAVAYGGTVAKVLVKAGDKVTSGRILMQLTDSGPTSDYQQLVDRRQEYEKLMQELFQMYHTGSVTAPCDGIVSGVDEKGTFLLSGAEEKPTEKPLTAVPMTAGSGSVRLVFLSGRKEPSASIVTAQLNAGTVGIGYTTALQAADGTELLSGLWAADGLPSGLSIDADTGVISGVPTQAGEFAVTVSFTWQETVLLQAYTLTVAEPQPEAKLYFGHVARVVQAVDGAMKVMQTAYSYPITDLAKLPAVTVDTDAMTVENLYMDPQIKADALEEGDILLIVADETGAFVQYQKLSEESGGEKPGGSEQQKQPEKEAGEKGSRPSTGGKDGMGGRQEETFELYSLEKLTVASVTSQKQMTVEITVDEQDITKIHLGQAADVTLEALVGEKFSAVVTKIAASGVNEGGSSKFAVELTLEKSGDMLPGMSASAVITLDTAENVVCIPATALYEEAGKTIVYTSYDPETETLGAPVTVTIGTADADYVQIREGLDAGTAVYYAYYDTPEQSVFR